MAIDPRGEISASCARGLTPKVLGDLQLRTAISSSTALNAPPSAATATAGCGAPSPQQTVAQRASPSSRTGQPHGACGCCWATGGVDHRPRAATRSRPLSAILGRTAAALLSRRGVTSWVLLCTFSLWLVSAVSSTFLHATTLTAAIGDRLHAPMPPRAVLQSPSDAERRDGAAPTDWNSARGPARVTC